MKVDAKTKAQLDEWKAKKRSANGVCCSSVILIIVMKLGLDVFLFFFLL